MSDAPPSSFVPLSGVEDIVWPAVPAPLGASMLAMQFQLGQSERWPGTILHQWQFVQLRHLLIHALAYVPHYRESYTAAGVGDPAQITPETWIQIPFLTRRDIQDRGAALRSTRVLASHGRWLEYGSSGSTGEPIRVHGTELTNFFFGALALRNHLWHGHDLGAKLATIRTVVGNAALPSWGPALDVAFRTGPCVTLNIVADLDQQIRWLLEQQPAYLLTHPSNLSDLAREFIRRDLGLPGLREAWTFGEVVSPELRAACNRAWGVKLTDVYTAEEVGYIALQCPEREHYHVQAENVLVEIVDEQGRACRPGAVGRVVITTLHNFAMPMIRYANGDYAEVGEHCSCGRGLPVLRRIMGRARNMVTLPDGSRHWPSFPAESWETIAPIRQIQLVQRSLSTVEARVVVDRDLTIDETRRFKAALQTTLGYPFEIDIARVQAIQRSPGLKFEDFVSKLSA